MSDSLVIWWSRLLATSATTHCSSLLSPLPCKCFGIGSYEVEYDFSFVLQGALVWALGSTVWLHTVWSEAEWASWSEVLRNEKIVLFFDNKEATTFGSKEKSLLLEVRKSHYYWMTKEVSISVIWPFSFVVSGHIAIEEIIPWTEYERLKQRIEGVINFDRF